MKTRLPAVAGTFYPGEKEELVNEVRDLLAAAVAPAVSNRIFLRLLALAAAVALVAGLSLHLTSPPESPSYVARIHQGENLPEQFEVGQWLPKGELSIAAGRMAITFDSGASLTLEGPARINLLNANEARIAYGKARALVPEEAIGFTLHTPSGRILDLGTEFALDVKDDGLTQLQVLDGLVEASGADQSPQLVHKDQQLQISASGKLEQSTAAIKVPPRMNSLLEKQPLIGAGP